MLNNLVGIIFSLILFFPESLVESTANEILPKVEDTKGNVGSETTLDDIKNNQQDSGHDRINIKKVTNLGKLTASTTLAPGYAAKQAFKESNNYIGNITDHSKAKTSITHSVLNSHLNSNTQPLFESTSRSMLEINPMSKNLEDSKNVSATSSRPTLGTNGEVESGLSATEGWDTSVLSVSTTSEIFVDVSTSTYESSNGNKTDTKFEMGYLTMTTNDTDKTTDATETTTNDTDKTTDATETTTDATDTTTDATDTITDAIHTATDANHTTYATETTTDSNHTRTDSNHTPTDSNHLTTAYDTGTTTDATETTTDDTQTKFDITHTTTDAIKTTTGATHTTMDATHTIWNATQTTTDATQTTTDATHTTTDVTFTVKKATHTTTDVTNRTNDGTQSTTNASHTTNGANHTTTDATHTTLIRAKDLLTSVPTMLVSTDSKDDIRTSLIPVSSGKMNLYSTTEQELYQTSTTMNIKDMLSKDRKDSTPKTSSSLEMSHSIPEMKSDFSPTTEGYTTYHTQADVSATENNTIKTTIPIDMSTGNFSVIDKEIKPQSIQLQVEGKLPDGKVCKLIKTKFNTGESVLTIDKECSGNSFDKTTRIKGLDIGHCYLFEIRVVDEKDKEMGSKTHYACTRPKRPHVESYIQNRTTNSLTLQIAHPHEGHFDSFEIDYKMTKDHDSIVTNRSLDSVTKVELSPLLPGSCYDIDVFAISNGQRSVKPRSFSKECLLPSSPGQNHTVVFNQSSFTLSWLKPYGNVDGYLIDVSCHPSNIGTHNYTSTSVLQVIGVTPGDCCQVNVTAASNQLYSSPKSFYVDINESVPEEVHVTANTTLKDKLFVAWSPPVNSNGLLLGYKIQLYDNTHREINAFSIECAQSEMNCNERFDMQRFQCSNFVLKENTSNVNFRNYGTSFTLTISDLLPGLSYYYNISAHNKMGFSSSRLIKVQTLEDKPSAPAELDVIVLNTTSINITWLPPKTPNGVITKYNVTYGKKYNQKNSIEVDFDVYTLMLTDLNCWNEYEICVSARTSAGYGIPRCGTGVTNVYEPLSQIKYVREHNSSIELDFETPCEGLTINITYKISYVSLNHTCVIDGSNNVTNHHQCYYGNPCEITGLHSYWDYYIQVQETVEHKVGPWSKSFSAKTQQDTTTTTSLAVGERKDVRCDADSMSIFIPTSLLSQNESLTWRDPHCKPTDNRTHYVSRISLTDCGTTVKFTTDEVIFENDLFIHNNVMSQISSNDTIDFGSTGSDIIPVQCVYPRTENITLSYRPAQTHIRFYEKRYGHMNLDFEQYKSEKFVNVMQGMSTPMAVPINKDMFIRLHGMHINSTDIAIKVDSCVATPSIMPAYGNMYQLIDQGCPASPAVKLYPSTYDEFKFSVKTFEFKSSPGSVVYIHCQVSICSASNPQCITGCRIRHRRDVDDAEHSSHLVSGGPYIIVADEGSIQMSTIVAGVCAFLAVVATVVAVIGWRKRATTTATPTL